MAIIAKGLDGIIVDTTAVSQVTPGDVSSLVYRGYPVQELAEHCSFEEVAYLLWYGELPNRDQLADFSSIGRESRPISKPLLDAIKMFPKTAHPMDAVRTGVSWLGMEAKNTLSMDASATQRASIDLMAKIPTIIAATYRTRHGKVRPAREVRTPVGRSLAARRSQFRLRAAGPIDPVVVWRVPSRLSRLGRSVE